MRTLPDHTGLLELLEERAFTVARLLAHPLTPALARGYDAFRAECLKALEKQVSLIEDRARARAVVLSVDAQLDRRLGGIVDTLLQLTDDDRRSALYKRFLGDEPPSRVARPVLGKQLSRMESWLDLLASSPHPELKAHHAELEKLVKAGRQAEQDARKAREALETFNSIGERKQLIDKLGVQRDSTYHSLIDLHNQNPGAGLPADFAETFFIREPGRTEPTLDSIEQNIDRLTAELQKQQSLRAELVAVLAADARRRAEAEAEEAREEVETLKREMAEKAARLAELEKKIPPTR